MSDPLLSSELELTKENLLAHFKKVAINGEITTQQVLANALDHWRHLYLPELGIDKLVEMISQMCRKGERSYANMTEEELLDAIWGELIEVCGHTQIDALVAQFDFLS